MIDINGFTNETDVLTSIKENIQDGNTDTAIDMIINWLNIMEKNIEMISIKVDLTFGTGNDNEIPIYIFIRGTVNGNG